MDWLVETMAGQYALALWDAAMMWKHLRVFQQLYFDSVAIDQKETTASSLSTDNVSSHRDKQNIRKVVARMRFTGKQLKWGRFRDPQQGELPEATSCIELLVGGADCHLANFRFLV